MRTAIVLALFALAALLLCGCYDSSPQAKAAREARAAAAEAQRVYAQRYLDAFRVARVCPSADGSTNYVLIGPDDALYVSPYSRPTDWGSVSAVAPGLAAKDVC